MSCLACSKKPFTHRIVVQAANSTGDGMGGEISTWDTPTTVATLRASVEPLRGSERFRAQQLESPVTHKITTRYKAGIKPEHRISFKGRIFNIRTVINVDEESRFLEIMAEEGVAT